MKRMFSALPLAIFLVTGFGQAAAQPAATKPAVAASKAVAQANLQQFVGKWAEEGGLNLRFEIKLVEGKLQVVQVFPASGKSSPCDNVTADGKSLAFDIKLGQRKDASQAVTGAAQGLPGVPPGARVQVQTAQQLGLRLMLSEDRAALQGVYASDLPLNGLPTQLKRVVEWPPAAANAGPVVIRSGPGSPPQIQPSK